MSQCCVSYLKPCMGLCKTLTLDWTGLWTGLDYGLDWTGLTKTAVYRQRALPKLQLLFFSSASSCFLAVEASVPQFLRGQRSRA